MDEFDRLMVRTIQKIHRRGCRIFAYRVALHAETTDGEVKNWFHRRGLWFNRRGCRARGEWCIENPKAFEPVKSELGEVFREAVHQW
ncbi:MAG: hypothetical protein J5I35_11490 [Methanothrix harundinacea]|nr:hypothetical protein [Methanothrix harundinacea]